jgi:hypothetical protein
MVLKQVAEEIGRAGWGTVLVFSLCAVGVITVSESLSNALVDTSFYFIRISNEPVWVELLTPFGLRTGTWFTFCSMVVTSIAAVIITVQLSAYLPGGARAYLRFGSFFLVAPPPASCSTGAVRRAPTSLDPPVWHRPTDLLPDVVS